MVGKKAFTVVEIVITLCLIAAVAFVGWRIVDDSGSEDQPNLPPPVQQQRPQDEAYPEVWTKNGFDGASYEFKVNCVGEYDVLEECILWDLTEVSVTDPAGKVFQLDKDFNINSYSGEVTRRWVLYGEAGAGFPKKGVYTFNYFNGDEKVLSQEVTYTPNVLDPPSNIKWSREGNDLHVSWAPPAGIKDGDWYKVIIFRDSEVISQIEEWDVTSTVLKDLPLEKGEKVGMNVSSYFSGGYAYPETIEIVW